MKLILVSTEFPPGPGGIGTHAEQVSRQLLARGWDVTVVTPQDYVGDAEIAAYNAQAPFRVVRLGRPPGGSPTQLAYRSAVLAREIRRVRPDILLATGIPASWVTSLTARAFGLPWAVVAHGGVEFGTPVRWQKTLIRRAYRRADSVICVSHYAKRRMDAAGVTARRAEVIWNGADDTIYYPIEPEVAARFRQRGPIPDNAPLLLTVGHVSERKGQDVVVRAMPGVLERVPDAHYAIVGLPSQGERIREIAAELGVSDRVHLLGRIEPEALVAAYNACDVFVMTSRHDRNGDSEGFGIAAVEAALCGKPSVASRGSGLEEAVLDGETGLLVDEDDPRGTAEALARLLADAPLRARLGAAARRRALDELTWSAAGAAYDRLLRELADVGSLTATPAPMATS